MRKPQFDMTIFKNRRTKLRDLAPGAAFLLPAAPEIKWVPYRQDSNFFYLSGFEEPGSFLLIRPGQTPESILFVRPKDPLRETWDGFRYGPEASKTEFLIDQTYLASDFLKYAPQLLQSCEKLYFSLGADEKNDRLVMTLLDEAKAARGRNATSRLSILDPNEILGEMRVLKSHEEQEWMKESCALSARAHASAMGFANPGKTERQVMGHIVGQFLEGNARREGYATIMAGGANSTTLHYIFNDQVLMDGDLLLIDAGGEKNYYTADITRTFPINGHFSGPQKAVYEQILSVQKALILEAQIGQPFSILQEKSVELLTEAMLELKLLSGSLEENIQTLAYKKYYPHGVSHFLGMDVHDVGAYVTKDGKPRPFQEGMCFTVEPGLYIPLNDESAPKEFRGIGIRIEDDILMTAQGPLNMTELAPKEITAVEATCQA